MFPSHFGYRRPNHAVVSMLNSPSCTLEALLGLEGVVEECRIENKTLIGFLRRPTVMMDLLRYALQAPDEVPLPDATDGSSDAPTGAASPAAGAGADGAPLPDGLAPAGASSVPELADASDQAAADRDATIRRSEAAAGILQLSNWQLIEVFEDRPLFEALFAPLRTDARLSPTVASRFFAVASVIIRLKPVYMYEFLRQNADLADCLLHHVQVDPINKIPLAIVENAGNEQKNEAHVKLLDWLMSANFVPKVIERLANATHAHQHDALGHLFLDLIDTCLAAGLASSEIGVALTSADALACLIRFATEPGNLSLALTIISRMLQLRAAALVQTHNLHVVLQAPPPVPLMVGMPEPPVPHEVRLKNDRARLVAAASTGLLSGHLDNLVSLLKTIVQKLHVAPVEGFVNQVGRTISEPLGTSRLELILFLANVLHVSDEALDGQLVELGFFRKLLDLFFDSPCNNALHAAVCDIVATVLAKAALADARAGAPAGPGTAAASTHADEASAVRVAAASSVALNHLLGKECALLVRIEQAAKIDAETSSTRKGFRGGHMAHVHVLANALEESTIPSVVAARTADSQWGAFVETSLLPFNKLNTMEIAGGKGSQGSSVPHMDMGTPMPTGSSSGMEDLQQMLSKFLGNQADLSAFMSYEQCAEDDDDYEEDDYSNPPAALHGATDPGSAAPGDGASAAAGDFEYGPDRLARMGDDSFGMEQIDEADGGPIVREGHSDDDGYDEIESADRK